MKEFYDDEHDWRFAMPEIESHEPAVLLPIESSHAEELSMVIGKLVAAGASPTVIGNPDRHLDPTSTHHSLMSTGFEIPPTRVNRQTLGFFIFNPPDRYYPSVTVEKRNLDGELVKRYYYTTSMSAKGHARFDQQAVKKLRDVSRQADRLLKSQAKRPTQT